MEKRQVQDGVAEYVLDSWRDFLTLATEEFATAPAYVYRGQADYEWRIESSLDRHERKYPKRKNLSGDKPAFFNRPPLLEGQHLAAFKRALRGRLGSVARELTDDEYWALGQHHGLVTPLTDWARSPFVGLFFAFEEATRVDSENRLSEPTHRTVYAFSTVAIEERKNATDRRLTLVSPFTDANPRLISQTGLLLKLPRHTDLESWVRQTYRDETHEAMLKKVKIPNQDRHGCLVALNKMNVNRMTLFPDADGAARYVNSLWEPGHEDSLAYV